MDNYRITLEEAKQKEGYKFWTLYDDMNTIREKLKENEDVFAVLELSCIDIEWTSRGYDDEITDEYPINEYFCCIRHKPVHIDDDGWRSDDGTDFGETLPMNFKTIEELEKDMFNQLLKYAEKHNLNLFDWN